MQCLSSGVQRPRSVQPLVFLQSSAPPGAHSPSRTLQRPSAMHASLFEQSALLTTAQSLPSTEQMPRVRHFSCSAQLCGVATHACPTSVQRAELVHASLRRQSSASVAMQASPRAVHWPWAAHFLLAACGVALLTPDDNEPSHEQRDEGASQRFFLHENPRAIRERKSRAPN